MTFLPLLALLVAAPLHERFFIGTYTPPGGSKGIYSAELDLQTGAISNVALQAETDNPSFIAIHPTGKFLYSAQEIDKGTVSAFAIEEGGKLRALDTQSTDGSGPCHVSVDSTGKYLFTACYNDGTLTSFPLLSDGSIGAAATIFRNSGSGPDHERQDGPHMHSAFADPNGRFVYSCDLGTDEVLRFRLDGETGALAATDPKAAKVTPGAGPRHLAFHPNGKIVYVNDEMGNAVTVFAWNPKSGAMSQIQMISTLPAGESVQGRKTAEIAIHPNGKWLYVSNRGDDTIAQFRILGNGKLELLDIRPAEVKVPRSFAIDPTGRWFIVAGQDSDDIATLKIDPRIGKLAPTGHKVSLGKPVCVVFAKKRL